MFRNRKTIENVRAEYEEKIRTLTHTHALQLMEERKNHELALKEKEFELRHFKDDEVMSLKEKVAAGERELAVLRKENEMLGKITNLNADIIDVKELVSQLINKLPEFKISNLTVNGNGPSKD